MSNEAGGGAPKKLSTKDILALARAQAANKEAEESAASPPAEQPAAAEPATASPAAEQPAAPAAPPGSTKDILAAARAQAAKKSGDQPAPAPASAPAGKPKSTADILAAARAQASAKAGGGDAAAEAKPAAAKPKSTADILAAARASAGGDGAAATKAAPTRAAPAKAASKGAAVAAAGGAKPSVQEMLAAVRGEALAAAVAAPPVEKKPVAAPPMPQKPVPAAKPGKSAGGQDRRSFLATVLSPFVLAWVAFAGATAAGVLGTLRFMLPNMLIEPPSRFKVGSPGDFDLGTVSEKFKASSGIWIVHTDKYQGRNLIYALSSVCTHLGCTPSWLEGEQKFKCPCHGSGFYITGINFEGPAPRPLERVGLRLAEDGMLEVDKSVKFQEELGQWNDPASFVEIV